MRKGIGKNTFIAWLSVVNYAEVKRILMKAGCYKYLRGIWYQNQIYGEDEWVNGGALD